MGGPGPLGGTEASLKPLWRGHPVPEGGQEPTWAIRLPACGQCDALEETVSPHSLSPGRELS